MTMRTILRLAVVASVVGLGRAHGERIAVNGLLGGISTAALSSAGGPAVWDGSDGNDLEIYYSDGISTTLLTDNAFDDSFPQLSGAKVVWQSWDGNDWEIFQFDGGVTSQLTNNDLDDIAAHFVGSNVRWQGWDGNDWEIFHFDGLQTTPLTDNAVDDRVLLASALAGGTTGEPLATSTSLGVSVPEPSSLALAAFGFAALSAWGWRRKR
jgi:hypothetical protein